MRAVPAARARGAGGLLVAGLEVTTRTAVHMACLGVVLGLMVTSWVLGVSLHPATGLASMLVAFLAGAAVGREE